VTGYPGPTKTLSANYTVAGTQFAYADEDADVLEPEDIWRHGRATEEHTHDSARGLPVRRIETASNPAAPGHVQILSDDLRWWGAVAGAIRTAVSREGNQTLDGTWRFNAPVLLAAQLTTPAAPGASLSLIYVKPDGKMYIRSGSGPEQTVGPPPTWNLPAKTWETTQVPGQQPALVSAPFASPTWVLAYDPTTTETAYSRVRVPGSYVAGLPLSLAVAWSAANGANGQTLNWVWTFARASRGEAIPHAWGPTATIAATYTGAAGDYYQLDTGTTTIAGLQPGDTLYVALARTGAVGNVAGDAYVLDASVAFA
jgi:hypothetical protein